MNKLQKTVAQSLVLILCIFFIGAVGFYYLLEKLSFMQCIYLTVVTLTTVGYGDISPLGNLPQGGNEYLILTYTILLIIFGMSVFLYAIGTITEYIVSGEMTRERRRRIMEKLIAALDGHYIVCGAGETGVYILQELQKTDRRFVVIESSESRIHELQEQIADLRYVCADATQDAAVEAAGVARAAGIIFAMPDEKDNLFAVLSLSQKRASLRKGFRIAAKVIHWEKTADKMRSAGADIVISPQFIAGRRMVSEMFRPALTTFLDRMLRDNRAAMRVEQVTLRPGSPIIGQTLEHSGIRQRTGLVIVSIRKRGAEDFLHNPPPEQVLEEGDVLICLGDMKKITLLRLMAGRGD